MGRLSKLYAQANDAVAGFEVAAERDVIGIIERTQELHRKREEVALQKHTLIDQHMTDLHEFSRDLDDELRGNDAPPDGSEGGEKPAPLAGAEPAKLAANAWTDGNAYAGTTPDEGTA